MDWLESLVGELEEETGFSNSCCSKVFLVLVLFLGGGWGWGKEREMEWKTERERVVFGC